MRKTIKIWWFTLLNIFIVTYQKSWNYHELMAKVIEHDGKFFDG